MSIISSHLSVEPVQVGRVPILGGATMVVSLVSHGHGSMVQRLLLQIAQHCSEAVTRVVLTLNVPEAEPVAPILGWPFALEVRRNHVPLGFGSNHNAALKGAAETFVCVLNPDVVLLGNPFEALANSASSGGQSGSALSYPAQLDGSGRLQSSERELPSPWALFQRRVLGREEKRVDWVNAACLVLPLAAWRQVQGFDEAYHMYCEDVDLCLRLRLVGVPLVRAPVSVIHVGQRASGRQLRHLVWHIASLFRLWRSPVYRRARNLVTMTQSGGRRITPP